MYHQWNWISFIHWRYPSAAVEPMLPAGLTLETFDGSAWIGLTPFLMAGVRAPSVPAVPWLSRFPETNVRRYVRDGRGRSGIRSCLWTPRGFPPSWPPVPATGCRTSGRTWRSAWPAAE
jgi:uncharacterized protein YqjF (DUF2071 family)